MVNKEMLEDTLSELGGASAESSENDSTISESQVAEPSSQTPQKAATQSNVADLENGRLSTASLYCSLPLNRDVQNIIDTFPKTENEKIDKKTRKLPCLYCDRTFVADNLRQKHVERSHSIKQARRSSSRFHQSAAPIKCLFCNKFTLSENKLNDLFHHLVVGHPNRYFGCLPCKERFTSSTLLKDHNEIIHKISQETNVQSIKSDSDIKKNSAIVKNKTVKTKHRAKIKSNIQPNDVSRPNLRRTRLQVTQKKLRSNRIALKSTKSGIKRSARLKNKVIQRQTVEKRQKPKERRTSDEQKSDKEKEVKITPNENPYPTFDAFYRVKKITDHSIDNLRISSLTFNDVFDQAFFTRIKCNIRENLLNHIDGKLFNNEESESRISNFEKTPQLEVSNTENFGCDLSLNAATPVATSLLTTQYGDDPESHIEYGAKASKKKVSAKQDEVHYKYFTRRKYQASILESKENRDLSKLDMWTQFIIKSRQQKVEDATKVDRERIDYRKEAKRQNEELNRILDRRGPFEDLKEEANKKAALEGNFNQEAHVDVTCILEDLLGNVFSQVGAEIEIKTELTDTEIPSYLNLRKASLSNESFIDRSDKITLICASEETENFEAPDIAPRDKNTLVELTGEWARSRLYICAACGLKLVNIKSLIDHKNIVHQNVWCQHYEFVGGQGGFYKHLSIPSLGKMAYIEDSAICKMWKRSDARHCTKCKKQCNSLAELHRHVLECGEDWTWMLVRKKCKYRPFGAKTRKKRRGLFKRIIHKEKADGETREKKTYKKVDGPRVKPSDADTIERMLANLPPKRATRKVMSLKDGFPKKQSKPKPEESKAVQTKNSKRNVRMRKNNGEEPKLIKHSGLKCNPVGTIRKSVRNINKVISSKLLDNASTIMIKRKIMNNVRQHQRNLQVKNFAKRGRTSFHEKEGTIKSKKDLPKANDVSADDTKKTDGNVRATRRSAQLPNETENKDSTTNVIQLKPLIKRAASTKNKLTSKIIRTFSLRRKSKPGEDFQQETEQNGGKRKTKLDTFKNAVKKIKLTKRTKLTKTHNTRQTNKIVADHFLELGTKEVCSDVNELPEEEKDENTNHTGTEQSVIENLVSNSTDNNEESKTSNTPPDVDIEPSFKEQLVNVEECQNTEPIVSTGIPDNIISLNPETAVEPSTSDETTANKPEETAFVPDIVIKVENVDCDDQNMFSRTEMSIEKVVKPKTKICKRAKGLNACIAMLTSKLQQKEVNPSFTESDSSVCIEKGVFSADIGSTLLESEKAVEENSSSKLEEYNSGLCENKILDSGSKIETKFKHYVNDSSNFVGDALDFVLDLSNKNVNNKEEREELLTNIEENIPLINKTSPIQFKDSNPNDNSITVQMLPKDTVRENINSETNEEVTGSKNNEVSVIDEVKMNTLLECFEEQYLCGQDNISHNETLREICLNDEVHSKTFAVNKRCKEVSIEKAKDEVHLKALEVNKPCDEVFIDKANDEVHLTTLGIYKPCEEIFTVKAKEEILLKTLEVNKPSEEVFIENTNDEAHLKTLDVNKFCEQEKAIDEMHLKTLDVNNPSEEVFIENTNDEPHLKTLDVNKSCEQEKAIDEMHLKTLDVNNPSEEVFIENTNDEAHLKALDVNKSCEQEKPIDEMHLKTLDVNKPSEEVFIEKAMLETQASEISLEEDVNPKLSAEIPVLEQEKENIEIEVNAKLEAEDHIFNEVCVEKDIIKCFEDINAKEHLNGGLENLMSKSHDNNKNGVIKQKQKATKKIGAAKRRVAKKKCAVIDADECSLPVLNATVENKLNTAMILNQTTTELDCLVPEKKLGQKRDLPQRRSKMKSLEVLSDLNIIAGDQAKPIEEIVEELVQNDVVQKEIAIVNPADDITIPDPEIGSFSSVVTEEVEKPPETIAKLNKKVLNGLLEQKLENFVSKILSRKRKKSKKREKIRALIESGENLLEPIVTVNVEDKPIILDNFICVEEQGFLENTIDFVVNKANLEQADVIAENIVPPEEGVSGKKNEVTDSEDELPLALLANKADSPKCEPVVNVVESNEVEAVEETNSFKEYECNVVTNGGFNFCSNIENFVVPDTEQLLLSHVSESEENKNDIESLKLSTIKIKTKKKSKKEKKKKFFSTSNIEKDLDMKISQFIESCFGPKKVKKKKAKKKKQESDLSNMEVFPRLDRIVVETNFTETIEAELSNEEDDMTLSDILKIKEKSSCHDDLDTTNAIESAGPENFKNYFSALNRSENDGAFKETIRDTVEEEQVQEVFNVKDINLSESSSLAACETGNIISINEVMNNIQREGDDEVTESLNLDNAGQGKITSEEVSLFTFCEEDNPSDIIEQNDKSEETVACFLESDFSTTKNTPTHLSDIETSEKSESANEPSIDQSSEKNATSTMGPCIQTPERMAVDANDSSYIQTPDLNDTEVNNTVKSKLKIRQGGRKKKGKNVKRKERENSLDNFCDICNKMFMRSDSLVKHKRTLTHIAKLSEIEAREAEERAKLREMEEQITNNEVKCNGNNEQTETVESPSENFKTVENSESAEIADTLELTNSMENIETVENIETMENIETVENIEAVENTESVENNETVENIEGVENTQAVEIVEVGENTEIVENIETNPSSMLVPSSFGLKNNNDTLKLADIINDVLNKPVDNDNMDSFSDLLEQKQETKRYKSLGERKSFDSDTMIYTPTKSNFGNHINSELLNNKLSNSTDAFLEKQISLLENIIEENKERFQYMDEISVASNKSDERCPSDMSLVSDIKQDDSNIIFSHNTNIVNSIINSEENFIKPSQYEEISEDSLKNFEDQRSRKTLNRDEELFLECCSLLKSSSEVSDYSKKSGKLIPAVNEYGMKTIGATDWLQQKPFAKGTEEFHSEDSYRETPIGENYDDFSNSDTIKTDWNTKMKDREFDDISLDSNSGNNSGFNNFDMHFAAKNDVNYQEISNQETKKVKVLENITLKPAEEDDATAVSKKTKSMGETTQTSIVDYAVPLPKKQDDSVDKKLLTKGAMKIFEGLKVSIPTEELNMKEVLNCSPTLKRFELENDEEKHSKVKNNLNKYGNKLGLKITKKWEKPKRQTKTKLVVDEESKVHDIYDFEETQDNTDLFIPNNLTTFRNQLAEKKDNEIHNVSEKSQNGESDDESDHYIDSFSYEEQSASSDSTTSSASVKKNTGIENITKKKCVIMGRIFKNAIKSKADEIKDIPVIDNSKLVENYVMSCPDVPDSRKISEERIKMTEQEMDLLFDKLLEESASLAKNSSRNRSASKKHSEENKGSKGKQKNSKQKKRPRKNSQSSDDEFNINKSPKKRMGKKKGQEVDNAINLEQELKECMGVAGRKSQRKCTSGKQNVLVEVWSSDSEFEALLQQTMLLEPEENVEAPPMEVAKQVEEEVKVVDVPPVPIEPVSKEIIKEIVKDARQAKAKLKKKSHPKPKSAKTRPPTSTETLASNRRKRAAAETLYYWSSSSEDDTQNLIEIKSVRDENDDDDDRPMQHGWIVGDSPKKLVTMLAQAKGKKVADPKCIKEQGKKRTTM